MRRETNLKSGKTYVDRNGQDRQSSRLAFCGKSLAFGSHGVDLRYSDTAGAGIAGLQSCGSVWACPVCSEKINAERQSDLEGGIRRWLQAGHSVVFGTLTLRHHKGQSLKDLWDAISPAWNRTTSGAGVAWNGSKRARGDIGDKARFGIRGYVRVVEVKHGVNGWHPHIHFLLFLEQELHPGQLHDLESRLFARWETALAKKDLSVVREVGIDLRPVTSAAGMGDYFAKNTYTGPTAGSAAYEVTGSQSKRQGKGGVTPFQILARLVEHGEESDLALWHEWERASQGRRQLTWSRGLRELLDLGKERTDEEIAEEEIKADSVVRLEEHFWKSGRWYDRTADLLEAIQAGPAALRSLVGEGDGVVWFSRGSAGWAAAGPPAPPG